MAQLVRSGWFKTVHVKSVTSQELRTLLTSREFLVNKLRDHENEMRGALRPFGFKVGKISASGLPRGAAFRFDLCKRFEIGAAREQRRDRGTEGCKMAKRRRSGKTYYVPVILASIILFLHNRSEDR